MGNGVNFRLWLNFLLIFTLFHPAQSHSEDINASAIGGILSSSITILGGFRMYSIDSAGCSASPVVAGACTGMTIDVLTITAGVATLGLSVYSMLQTDGDGGGGDPPPGICDTTPKPDFCTTDNNPTPDNSDSQLCRTAPELCNCSGPSAATNPVCNPDAITKDIPRIKSDIERGIISPPDGKSKEDFFNDLDNLAKDLGTLNGIATGALPDSAIAELSSIKGSGFNSAGRAGAGDAGAGDFNEDSGFSNGSSGGGLLGAFGSGSKTVGPADTTGLGRALFDGLLNLIDAATGKDLTVFQRNTRRLQSFEDKGKRAFAMARIEQIRQAALKYKESLKTKTLAKAPIKSQKTKKTNKLVVAPKSKPKQKSERLPASTLN